MIKLAFRTIDGQKVTLNSDEPMHDWSQEELTTYIWEALRLQVKGVVLVEVLTKLVDQLEGA